MHEDSPRIGGREIEALDKVAREILQLPEDAFSSAITKDDVTNLAILEQRMQQAGATEKMLRASDEISKVIHPYLQRRRAAAQKVKSPKPVSSGQTPNPRSHARPAKKSLSRQRPIPPDHQDQQRGSLWDIIKLALFLAVVVPSSYVVVRLSESEMVREAIKQALKQPPEVAKGITFAVGVFLLSVFAYFWWR